MFFLRPFQQSPDVGIPQDCKHEKQVRINLMTQQIGGEGQANVKVWGVVSVKIHMELAAVRSFRLFSTRLFGFPQRLPPAWDGGAARPS